jgi:hypothetical protein
VMKSSITCTYDCFQGDGVQLGLHLAVKPTVKSAGSSDHDPVHRHPAPSVEPALAVRRIARLTVSTISAYVLGRPIPSASSSGRDSIP